MQVCGRASAYVATLDVVARTIHCTIHVLKHRITHNCYLAGAGVCLQLLAKLFNDEGLAQRLSLSIVGLHPAVDEAWGRRGVYLQQACQAV